MMTEKINVLHICSWFPHRTNPHDGNFVVKHIRVLNDEVNQVALAVYEDENLTASAYEFDEGGMDGFPFLVIYHKPISFKPLKILFRLYLYWMGVRHLKKSWNRFDLIHAHVLQFAGVFSWIYAFFSKTPYVVTEHSSFFQQEYKGAFFLKWILQKAAGNSQFILPVSDDLAEKMQSFGLEGNFLIVPNVVNTNLFTQGNRAANDPLQFLHISSFLDMKNVPGIIKTVKKLSAVRSDFSMTIAGEGNLAPLLRQKKQLNISDDFLLFGGEMTEDKVAELMQSHDVFVLFSDYENLPCVLLEAQACGMVIIATDVGGISEIVASESFGELITPRDEIRLLEAMQYQIDNYANYNQALIRNRAVAKYGEEKIRQLLVDVYTKCI